jgi:hypothetical protein
VNPQRNGDARFRVSLTDRAADQLAAILRRAEQLGRGPAVAAAARLIQRRLENDPRVFGEPIRTRSAAHIDERHGGVAPLFVNYGVLQTELQVFVREFRALL